MMKWNRWLWVLGIFSVVFFGISRMPSLLANYNVVEDMTITPSTPSVKEGETAEITVTDTNKEDKKLVVPMDGTMEYLDSTCQDGTVIYDEANQQLVIDWLADDAQDKKEVTMTVRMKQAGTYPLKAMTVRDNQEVTTKEAVVEVVKETEQTTTSSTFSEQVAESVDSTEEPVQNQSTEEESSEETDTMTSNSLNETPTSDSASVSTDLPTASTTKETEKSPATTESASTKAANKKRTDKETKDASSKKWGSASYEFDAATGVLTVSNGTIDKYGPAGIQTTEIKQIVFQENVKAPADSSDLFSSTLSVGYINLQSISGSLDTSNVTDMSDMFIECSALKSVDVSNWDTSNVTDMSNMFASCRSLSSVDVSNWDTSKVTNMNSMFSNCSMSSVDASNWDTSNVTDMSNMFDYCPSLSSVDVSNWDTSKVTNMRYMFDYCPSLSSGVHGT
ncbi:DUF285 domain-containing protein [Enterococcus faecalis]|uniref:BspA family leucine-rich repeat surface protein n=1 Tax=Enterococcus faecalis TaxID=1351 RepID=UPI0019FFAB55|nr:BspA family leucine-rich repeat surface protein [Enterococcus faecalis]MDF4035852.1 BspA family leucine-rich repeat surface protein [Staphylococcus aureus]EGO5060705.1 DUF285 domain-containing protein [Enterococcus faecalis]EHB6442752.1 DUF285 domain-containing protein [Enterococcus faecalis]EHM3140223.1 DUF285 domain-containing protein [Enterococcus faecalis]EJE4049237.1 DUF285 domain-containing protein [Enterococcus faecalis]